MNKILPILVICLLFLAASATGRINNNRCRLELSKIENVLFTTEINVSVNIVGMRGSFDYFKLDIAFNDTLLEVIEVLPGNYLDRCGRWDLEWQVEYSNHYNDTGPLGQLTIIGTKKRGLVWRHLPGRKSLVDIRFYVRPERGYSCVQLPLKFRWLGCYDNHLAKRNNKFVSRNVYSFDGLPEQGWSFSGLSEQCLDQIEENSGFAYHSVDFVNGYVSIMCPEDIWGEGDLNLNGISFEGDDFQIFKNYFLTCGLSAFQLDPQLQIEQTNVIPDIVPLGLDDLVYFCRIMNNEDIPYDELSPFTGRMFYQPQPGKINIRTDFAKSGGAVHLVFDVGPEAEFEFEAADDLEFEWNICDNKLKILILDSIPAGDYRLLDIISENAELDLTSVMAAGFNGENINLFVDTIAAIGIEIARIRNQLQGHYSDVPVIKKYGDHEFYGFDLLIGYDRTPLTCMGAVPGDIFNIPGSYEWEYFTYRFGPFVECDSCPSGQLRLVGMAESNDGPHHPLDRHVPDGGELFKIVFWVTNDRTYECAMLPIEFIWLDCGDNVVSIEDPNHYLNYFTCVSRAVKNRDTCSFPNCDPHWNDAGNPDDPGGYPTLAGYQNLCSSSTAWQDRIPAIDFYNGFIHIICADIIDARGDVNLNGIRYEVADLIAFQNYFLYGLDSFIYDQNGQAAASDVNRDCFNLTLDDFVYLLRVITGDALSYVHVRDSFDVALRCDRDNNQIAFSMNSELAVGAVYLKLYPESCIDSVTFNEDINELETYAVSHNDTVNILVYSWNGGDSITANMESFVTAYCNDSEPTMITAAVSSYYGLHGVISINWPLPEKFELRQNFPNPFNMLTTISFDMTSAGEWNVQICNILGREVKTFTGYSEPGAVRIDWDGTDESGRDLASGVYFFKVMVGQQAQTRKMVILK